MLLWSAGFQQSRGGAGTLELSLNLEQEAQKDIQFVPRSLFQRYFPVAVFLGLNHLPQRIF